MNTPEEIQDKIDEIEDVGRRTLLAPIPRGWVELLLVILRKQLTAMEATPEEVAAGGGNPDDPLERKDKEIARAIADTVSIEAQFEKTLGEMEAALLAKELENKVLVQEIAELKSALPREVAESDAVRDAFMAAKRRYNHSKTVVVSTAVDDAMRKRLDDVWAGPFRTPKDLEHRPFTMAVVHMLAVGVTDIATLHEGFSHYGPIAALCDLAMTWMAIASTGYPVDGSTRLLCKMVCQAATNAVDSAEAGSLSGASGLHGLLEKLYDHSGASKGKATATLLRKAWRDMREGVRDGALAPGQAGGIVVPIGGGAEALEIARLGAELEYEKKRVAQAEREKERLDEDKKDLLNMRDTLRQQADNMHESIPSRFSWPMLAARPKLWT
jgi:hypothetical protein